ncbi:GMP synthase [Tanacetum coccineum]
MIPDPQTALAKHLPGSRQGFEVDAKSEQGVVAAVDCAGRQFYGLKCHPEPETTNQHIEKIIINLCSITPVFAKVTSVFVTFTFAAMYGLAIAALGMLIDYVSTVSQATQELLQNGWFVHSQMPIPLFHMPCEFGIQRNGILKDAASEFPKSSSSCDMKKV